jgi:hypothetical protein
LAIAHHWILFIVHCSWLENPLSSVGVPIPEAEANLISSHKTTATSFRRCAPAEPGVLRDFLLKTGLKSELGSVEPEISATKSNRVDAVPSDSESEG